MEKLKEMQDKLIHFKALYNREYALKLNKMKKKLLLMMFKINYLNMIQLLMKLILLVKLQMMK